MALPRLPSLEEIWRSPLAERIRILERLPAPLQEIYQKAIEQISQAVSSTSSVPATPVEMALVHPKYRWMDTRHIHYLGDQVAAAVERSGAILVTMPPRHAKSSTCSVWAPFWFLAQRPDAHVFFISYEATFARKWGVRVRNLVELYGRDYGLELDPKKTAGDDWELTTGGGMKCVGAGGGIGGNPVKLLIVDDAIKNDEEARSQVIRESLWDWWDGTVIQRIEPDTTVIVIGTRYHEDDLIGRIIQHSRAGTGLKFEEVTLMATAEEDDPLGRVTDEGLWTDHPLPGGGTWGQKYYEEKKASVSSYTWNAVYQQRPSPPGGNTIDPEWWRFFRPSECPAEFDQEIQSWDLALDSAKKSDSYHCGGVLSRKGALVYIRDAFHAHSQIASSPDLGEQTVVGTIRVWNDIYPRAQQKLIERALAGPMLIQTLRHEMVGLIPWPSKGVRKGSKESNLNACVPAIRSGNVLLPLNSDGSRPKWVQELIEECRQFPRAPHDDWCDMISQGLSFLLPSVRRAVEGDMEEAKTRRPVESPEEEHVAGIHAMLAKLAKPKLDRMRAQQRRQDQAVVPSTRGISTSPYHPARRSNRGMW